MNAAAAPIRALVVGAVVLGAIGTRTIVEWPSCVLVDAFDLGGQWLTLTLQDGEVRDVVEGHHAGRDAFATGRSCA